MSVYEKYKLQFVNVAVEAWGGIIDKLPHGPQNGFLYSPLSVFLYMSAFYGGTESIDDIIATLDEALKGNIGDPDIPVEMTTTTLLNHTTIHILEDGTINEMILPIIIRV